MSTADYLSGLSEDELARIKDHGDKVEITLIDPLTYKHSKLDGERTLTSLTLAKKIKGKHMKAMDKASGEISQVLALAAALAGVPVNAMDELDARDLDLITAVLEPFLPKSRKTGTAFSAP